MRRFVRHPTNIPIDVKSGHSSSPAFNNGLDDCAMKTVSQGGLSCELPASVDVGTLVNISIPSVSPTYNGKGEIVWCQQKDGHFEVGVRFTDKEEAFKARMVQQVCEIERYKSQILEQEGRVLDADQAAAEWIAKYAENFPSL